VTYMPCYMLGRLSNGYERDKGKLVHAVPALYCGACKGTGVKHEWVLPEALLKPVDPPQRCDTCYGARRMQSFLGQALCRKQPGPRSVGWQLADGKEINCPRCLAKIAKLESNDDRTAPLPA